LLKAIQSHPKGVVFLPHSEAVASKLAQCLNPALPSGVHQKALEVYAYIFTTFSSDYLASHLDDYLPGLSPVLSFASLSVRPGLYVLFEEHITALPRSKLRPALKSIILALLPAIEEETAEDFDRAFAIIQGLEAKFTLHGNEQHSGEESHDGFFWQCMFLSVITSPSRRQGALHYMARQLPRLATQVHESGNQKLLLKEAEAVVSPEPGLLIRCFSAGLSDPQSLTQRGFLDLLVSHLPLHSQVLKRTEERDLHRLVAAAVEILLRKDMSLNRRLWSWFLGPDSRDHGDQTPSSPKPAQAQLSDHSSSSQFEYFEANGKGPLQRVVLDMFASEIETPAQLARPFRICLSLMDRWEIGGLLVPRIFLPALQAVYKYSLRASVQEVDEVLRSASLFFDGVEASLIWATFISILQSAFDGGAEAIGRLQLLKWVLGKFNVRDEEMITVHVPMALLYLSNLLENIEPTHGDDSVSELGIDIGETLLKLLPPRTLAQEEQPVVAAQHGPDIDVRRTVITFYRDSHQASDKVKLPVARHILVQLLLDHSVKLAAKALRLGSDVILRQVVPLLQELLVKATETASDAIDELVQTLETRLVSSRTEGAQSVSFPALSAIVSLLGTLVTTNRIPTESASKLEPQLTECLWHHLSPASPKYHVEAVKMLWHMERVVTPQDAIQVSLLYLMRTRDGQTGSPAFAIDAENIRRFGVLWTHSLPAQSTSKTGAFGLMRRGSAMPNTLDAAQAARRLHILAEPLLLVLDLLHDPSSPAYDAARRWLSVLPGLDLVFHTLFQRLEASFANDAKSDPDADFPMRWSGDRRRSLCETIGLFRLLLSCGNDWTWDTFSRIDVIASEQDFSAPFALARTCAQLLSTKRPSDASLDRAIIALLDVLVSGPIAPELRALSIDSILMDRLLDSLKSDDHELEGVLLEIIPKAVKVRLSTEVSESPSETRNRASFSLSRPARLSPKPNGTTTSPSALPSPPPQLLQCLHNGFASTGSRLQLDLWLRFLSSILPVFADAIFASLIPLVDVVCRQLDMLSAELLALAQSDNAGKTISPDAGSLGLLEALEMILARAYDCLLAESAGAETPDKPAPPKGFLGNVAAGVFRSDGPPSKTVQANSRLTVILAFQDAIRICAKMWSWSMHPTDAKHGDQGCAATTAYSALRVRNKTRHLLEQIFSVEPLESLEVLIAHTQAVDSTQDAATALSLLHVMHDSRPKNVIPAILDALCSRTNPTTLPPSRQSSQTVDLTAVDVARFLLDYLESIEDDATDEIWADCVAFLRDVLSNPLPYRQVLALLLSVVHLLAQKVTNTNFGAQRKMRRELGDIFQRLLAAALTTMPSYQVVDSSVEASDLESHRTTGTGKPQRASSLTSVLAGVVCDLEVILETSERTTAAVNSISSSLIAPIFHSKAFPANVSKDVLGLLLEMQKKAPNAKTWRKEVADTFNDPRLLATGPRLMEQGWHPILHQWTLRDNERMPELLSRLTPPSSAGIMFGVGASAARLDADRKTQLNLRRICLLLLASPKDAWVGYLRDFEEKIVELSSATESSSPSATIKSELFMLCRALTLCLSQHQLAPLWATINESLRAALVSLTAGQSSSQAFTNLGLLQACRLLDQLVALRPDEFQLHEWLYVTDTIDAVYRPENWESTALADHVSVTLRSNDIDDNDAQVQRSAVQSAAPNSSRLLLDSAAIDGGDVKAMDRDDFAKMVLRPFLGQLSIHAYEDVYSMEPPDSDACRRALLEDLLDVHTIVE
jgi:hypothetical protein